MPETEFFSRRSVLVRTFGEEAVLKTEAKVRAREEAKKKREAKIAQAIDALESNLPG